MIDNNTQLHNDVLNFSKFKKDLYKKFAQTGESSEQVSMVKLYRNKNYLTTAFTRKSLPINIFFALCNLYDLRPSDYEVKPEPKPEPKPEAKPEPKAEEPGNAPVAVGWDTRTRIDLELGVVVFTILKNGQEKVTARALINTPSDLGIIKDISYAAHMAYKLAQQSVLNDSSKTKKEIPIYKNWIKQFEKENSTYGKFARYVKDHYSYFPKSGEKDMHCYLLQNKGTEYISAFKLTFAEYLKFCEKMPPAATDGKRING